MNHPLTQNLVQLEHDLQALLEALHSTQTVWSALRSRNELPPSRLERNDDDDASVTHSI